MKKTLTLQGIQEKYPHPMSVTMNKTMNLLEGYCIGGAFCLSLEPLQKSEKGANFPERLQLAQHLSFYDDNQSARDYYLTLASIIIDLNDNERFEESWELLGEFLEDVNTRKE